MGLVLKFEFLINLDGKGGLCCTLSADLDAEVIKLASLYYKSS
jgi:hypothetical protein